MSTGYGWEGLRQVCATLLGARHVPERPCSGLVYLGRYNKCSPLPFFTAVLCQDRSQTSLGLGLGLNILVLFPSLVVLIC